MEGAIIPLLVGARFGDVREGYSVKGVNSWTRRGVQIETPCLKDCANLGITIH